MNTPMDALNDVTRALIEKIAKAGFPPMHTLPVEQARLSYRMGVSVSEVPRVPLARIDNFEIPASGGHSIPARLWAPSTEAGLPVLLYVHGGGGVIGSIDTCEAMCRSVAAQSGAAVVAVDYRLAPEHRFPAGLDDAWDALQWLSQHGHELDLDSSRLAIGGDSFGGTIAASAALMARDARLLLRLQALFYPSVQTSIVSESFKRYSSGLILNEAMMRWFDKQCKVPGQPDDWRRQPLLATSHQGVAPAWIGIAECDPLADDGRLYAQALEKAGVSVELSVWGGTVHDFINMGRFLPQAAQAHTALALAVKKAFQ